MKKSDSATGMIIDVPESMTYQSKFPYPGFWSGAYPLLLQSLLENTSLGKQNKALVNDALNASINLLNGEYAIFLTEKMWALGELLNLNPFLPIQGNVKTLGYVKEAPDGGRMQVAAMLFEPAITAMLNQHVGVSSSQSNVTMFSNELANLRAEQLRLNTRLAELEASTPSQMDVVQQERVCNQLKQMLGVLGSEVSSIEAKVQGLAGGADEKKRLELEFTELQNQVALIQRKIAVGTDTQSDRMMLGKIKSRMENLGLALQKGQYGNAGLEGDYRILLDYKRKEFVQTEAELQRCSAEATRMRNAYADGIREGQDVWNRIKTLTLQIEGSQASINKARNSVTMFSNEDSRNLVKVWVAHLSDARVGLEGALFQAKYLATSAISKNPRAMLAESLAIDPAVIRDYEDYNAAVTDIADAISNSEYDLLEQIGRLGLSMKYIPGSARVIALGDMRESERITAYRNMVEEILAQGQRLSADESNNLLSVGIGDLGIKIQATNELKEVKELLRHLADSRLNFKYGGEF
jgi:predicted  nucleic acid-binding Zn-ribbon protein